MIALEDFTKILHPMMVHFPIALILTATFLAVIYILKHKNPFVNRTIRVITILASISAWAAVVSGTFTPNFTGAINEVENLHHNFALISSILISIAAMIYILFRNNDSPLHNRFAWVAFGILLLSSVFIGITGYFGGYIVYNMLL